MRADCEPRKTGTCTIVVHRNYADGVDAYAFYHEDDAMRSVDEDVRTVERDLAEQGYESKTIRRGEGDVEIYAADGDIYYEWSVIPSEIS